MARMTRKQQKFAAEIAHWEQVTAEVQARMAIVDAEYAAQPVTLEQVMHYAAFDLDVARANAAAPGEFVPSADGSGGFRQAR